LLESHGSIFIVVFIVLLVLFIFIFFHLTLLERLAKIYALEDRVLSLWMEWARSSE
jgi:hypothetical protein